MTKYDNNNLELIESRVSFIQFFFGSPFFFSLHYLFFNK
jgi:hypothetical protein